MAAATEAITQKRLAHRLNLSTRQVRKLTNQSVFQRDADGLYPWPQSLDDYIRHKQAEVQRRAGPTDMAEVKLRKLSAEAEMAQIELAQIRQQMIAVDDVEADRRRMLEQLDATLRNAPSRHAPDLARSAKITIATAQRHLEAAIEEVRATLRSLGADDGDDRAAA